MYHGRPDRGLTTADQDSLFLPAGGLTHICTRGVLHKTSVIAVQHGCFLRN
jgi:hypothetical protein